MRRSNFTVINRSIRGWLGVISLRRQCRDNGDKILRGNERIPQQGRVMETRKKILCIEDDREAAALIAEELCERGFDVSVEYDGQAGLAAILRNSPDLVLCDVNMPIMSGCEVAERLASIGPDFGSIPFVFLTAMTDLDNANQARKLGSHLTKPIDFEALGLTIDSRLRSASRNTDEAGKS